MRIAVLADVHGNVRALHAVLHDIDHQSPDLILNLGDCLSGPLEAADVAETLMARGFPTIAGNHDRQLLTTPRSEFGASDRAADAQLTDAHREWLRGFPATMSVADELFLCHGSPRSDLEYLLEDIDGGRMRLVSREHLLERVAGVPENARVVLCGHSHIPRSVMLDGRLLVNPGSVGLQAYTSKDPVPHVGETGSPQARYALLDRRNAAWRVSLVAVEYDWTAAAASAAAVGFDEWALSLASGYAAPLA